MTKDERKAEGSLVRVELDEANSLKVRQVCQETNMSATQIVNSFMRAIMSTEIKQIVTFAIEVRSSDALGHPGRRQLIRKISTTRKNW